ncbi:MAG: OmpH family outer membrane protein [Crocinitomicaceae bacterium]|nr:OmpH family outer membrane protein [Crocinitomicaceae bacterium]
MKTLYILFFSGLFLVACNSNKEKEGEKTKGNTVTNKSTVPIIQSKDSTGLKIAFYNLDTLQERYVFFKKEYEKMTTKKKSFEKELLKKQKEFESFIERNEELAKKGLLSQIQMEKAQIKAQKLQREYTLYEQEKSMEMQVEGEKKMTLIYNQILTYSKLFCEQNNIDILLQSGSASQLGYINPTMNATNEFINYLNQKQTDIDKDLK